MFALITNRTNEEIKLNFKGTLMSAKLIYITPLWLIVNGIRYSHDNHHLSDTKEKQQAYITKTVIKGDFVNEKIKEHIIGNKDFDLIKRVGFKMKHESVLEHSLIIFEIEASRALLQELSRHRIGVSPTVKSTRYVLKKDLKNEKSFEWNTLEEFKEIKDRAKKYVYLTGYDDIDDRIIRALEELRWLIKENFPNDIIKYALPEAFLFKGQYSFNLRSLVHLLELRTNKDVLPEFQRLCVDIIDALPDDYKELVLTNEKIRTNYKRIKNDCKSN